MGTVFVEADHRIVLFIKRSSGDQHIDVVIKSLTQEWDAMLTNKVKPFENVENMLGVFRRAKDYYFINETNFVHKFGVNFPIDTSYKFVDQVSSNIS